MPSRFPGLAPHVTIPARIAEWDYYDNQPLDPAYIAPAGLGPCTRKPTP